MRRSISQHSLVPMALGERKVALAAREVCLPVSQSGQIGGVPTVNSVLLA
jgi:hypothetical protein